tara:strand:- start:183 stop:710 length:528 start_codon:yes stop_codon:yes gene_type:complete
MKIKIIDDCISLEKQNNIIKESLNNKYFPWFYKQDITSLRAGNQGRPALSHYYVLNRKTNSDFLDLILPIITPHTKNSIIQCRSFLQFPLNLKKYGTEYDSPHRDSSFPHTVYLYYVTDSDGDTLFLKNSKVVKKITPKQGRLVIFDGDIEHTAKQPQDDVRCVINFDIQEQYEF